MTEKNKTETSKAVNLDKIYQEIPHGAKTLQLMFDYLFAEANYFMLVYSKFSPADAKILQTTLAPYKAKARHDPHWPGTIQTSPKALRYDIVFYRIEDDSKKLFMGAFMQGNIKKFHHEIDFAFFKNNTCWFYSVAHEKIATLIRATDRDIAFFKSLKLINAQDVCDVPEHFFTAYDEKTV